ncbi:MAG TPA: hypothetical protein DF610_00285 [Sphingobacterium sp.]|nr:hypothetical protein FM120_17655 [Sphingobacterium faecium PCAi_F2.5]HCU43578.1 hypothetical protein [Sphingobacterium sp.]
MIPDLFDVLKYVVKKRTLLHTGMRKVLQTNLSKSVLLFFLVCSYFDEVLTKDSCRFKIHPRI